MQRHTALSRMKMNKIRAVIYLGFMSLLALALSCCSQAQAPAIPQYLTFQLLVYGPPKDGNVSITNAFDTTALNNTISEILTAVNQQTGDGRARQLGRIFLS